MVQSLNRALTGGSRECLLQVVKCLQVFFCVLSPGVCTDGTQDSFRTPIRHTQRDCEKVALVHHARITFATRAVC